MKVLTGVRSIERMTVGEAEDMRRQGADLEVSRKTGIIRIYRERQNHIAKEK